MIYRFIIIIPFLFSLYGCAYNDTYSDSCRMRAGSAMMGAENLSKGMAASGNVLADCLEKEGK